MNKNILCDHTWLTQVLFTISLFQVIPLVVNQFFNFMFETCWSFRHTSHLITSLTNGHKVFVLLVHCEPQQLPFWAPLALPVALLSDALLELGGGSRRFNKMLLEFVCAIRAPLHMWHELV